MKNQHTMTDPTTKIQPFNEKQVAALFKMVSMGTYEILILLQKKMPRIQGRLLKQDSGQLKYILRWRIDLKQTYIRSLYPFSKAKQLGDSTLLNNALKLMCQDKNIVNFELAWEILPNICPALDRLIFKAMRDYGLDEVYQRYNWINKVHQLLVQLGAMQAIVVMVEVKDYHNVDGLGSPRVFHVSTPKTMAWRLLEMVQHYIRNCIIATTTDGTIHFFAQTSLRPCNCQQNRRYCTQNNSCDDLPF